MERAERFRITTFVQQTYFDMEGPPLSSPAQAMRALFATAAYAVGRETVLLAFRNGGSSLVPLSQRLPADWALTAEIVGLVSALTVFGFFSFLQVRRHP